MRDDPEVVSSDSAAYDCKPRVVTRPDGTLKVVPGGCKCELRERIRGLESRNVYALRIYHALAGRVIRDLGLTPMVFDLLDLRMSAREGLALIDRLAIVHEFAGEDADPVSRLLRALVGGGADDLHSEG